MARTILPPNAVLVMLQVVVAAGARVCHAFTPVVPVGTRTFATAQRSSWVSSSSLAANNNNNNNNNLGGFDSSLYDLFQGEEDELFPIAERYVHAKYQQCAHAHGRTNNLCTKEDIQELLRSLLPPVTPQELDLEVEKTMTTILQDGGTNNNQPDKIEEDSFVKAIVQNSYWRSAGSLVVKELMYFDALYSYYHQDADQLLSLLPPLLNNDDYEELKDNLTWEGSSVPNMNNKEVLFVQAVAATKRGEPVMTDVEYAALKNELKQQGSWVVSRGKDALEKLGINTFLGYLHRALA